MPPSGASPPVPPRPQNLFWDLLDPVAAAPYSAHAFQRQQLPEIERRCAQLRVRAVAPVVGKPVEALGHGVERAIGHCTERGFEVQLVRIPRHGLPWGVQHTAAMGGARARALAPFAFLGVERAPGAQYDSTGSSSSAAPAWPRSCARTARCPGPRTLHALAAGCSGGHTPPPPPPPPHPSPDPSPHPHPHLTLTLI